MQGYTATLSRKQFAKLCAALRAYGPTLREQRDHEARRILTMFARTLPTHAPYTVTITAREWPIISRALRPEGSNPTPGSDAAKWYALYAWMILPQNFYGLRSLSPRTQREHAKRLSQSTHPN